MGLDFGRISWPDLRRRHGWNLRDRGDPVFGCRSRRLQRGFQPWRRRPVVSGWISGDRGPGGVRAAASGPNAAARTPPGPYREALRADREAGREAPRANPEGQRGKAGGAGAGAGPGVRGAAFGPDAAPRTPGPAVGKGQRAGHRGRGEGCPGRGRPGATAPVAPGRPRPGPDWRCWGVGCAVGLG